MAEIRCPMCGKLNPEELDVCQFCQARLKPLIGHQDDSLNKSEKSSSSSDSSSDSKINGSEGSETTIPDWLRAMGQSDEDLPEVTEERKKTDEKVETPKSELLPDWLGELQENADFFDESNRESEEEPLMEDESTSDWLQRLNTPDDEPEPQMLKKSQQDEIIDSIKNESKSKEFEKPFEESFEESKDRIDEFPYEKGTPELGGIRKTDEETDIPDWLKQMSEIPLEEPESTITETAPSLGEEVPGSIFDSNENIEEDLKISKIEVKDPFLEPLDEGKNQEQRIEPPEENINQEWLVERGESLEEKPSLDEIPVEPTSKKEFFGLMSKLKPANEEELPQNRLEESETPADLENVDNGEMLRMDAPEGEDKELFPDWLSEDGALEESSSREETLGWLSKLDEVEEDTDNQQVESPEIGVMPDWIAQLKPTAELKQKPELMGSSSEEDFFESEEPIELPQVEEEKTKDEPVDVSEILARQAEPVDKEENVAIPDRLQRKGKSTSEEPEFEEVPEEPPPMAEPLDWIAEFGNKQVEESSEETLFDEINEESEPLIPIKREEEPVSPVEGVEKEDEEIISGLLDEVEKSTLEEPTLDEKPEEPFQQPAIDEQPTPSDAFDEHESLDQCGELSEEEISSDLLLHKRPTEKLSYEPENMDLIEKLQISSDEKSNLLSEEAKVPSESISPQEEEREIDAVQPEKEELGLIPNWLSELALDEEDKEQGEVVPVLDDETIESDEEDIIVPDWIKELDDEEHPQKEDDTETLAVESLDDRSPEHIMEPAEIPSIDLEEGKIDQDVLKGDSLPDWISSVTMQDVDVGETELEDQLESKDLEKADLPSWLQGMRPKEPSKPIHEDLIEVDEHDDNIEGTGPLAGLHSVLSAEPEIAEIRTPQEISFGLSITKEQRASAKLLQELLANELKIKPIAEQKRDTTPKILRMVIGIILVIVIGGITLFGTQSISMPASLSFPPGVMDANGIVVELPADAHVLLAIDYDPNNAGEMDAAASPIIDHLMRKGAYLTMISTSPTGPALGEYLIGSVLGDNEYQRDTQYVNLGYLPGGASGLLSFILAPQRITPLTFDGEDAWNTTPLSGIEKLSDFDLILIVANNFQTIQNWIEQTQASLADTPMIVVSSAQTSPLVMPYYESPLPQIEGLVDGFMGGAAYEQITGGNGLGRDYWDAYIWGLVIALGAILISFVVYSVQKDKKQGKDLKRKGEDTE